MAKGVFLHRADSIYDDQPETQYQFPKQYLGRASAFVGDWILYYEPRKAQGGGKGYFAIARVERIVPDPTLPDMFLALIEPGSYLPFQRPVPFSGPEGPIERGVLNEAGKISGRAQSAVRPISIQDFDRILERGIPEETDLLPRTDFAAEPGGRVRDHRDEFVFEVDRNRIAYVTSRPVRDRVFRTLVLNAYDCRCAVTGLRLINGGGRPEVEAAHIRPVEKGGPDTVSNGLALSGTAHWMFDRSLISLGDDLEILVSRQANDPDSIWKLVNQSRKASMPRAAGLRPHPRFLDWHRRHCFKQ